MPGLDLADIFAKLAQTFGAPGAIAVCAWWLERKNNRELQKRLLRLAAAQLQAAGEIKAALDAIKEVLRK